MKRETKERENSIKYIRFTNFVNCFTNWYQKFYELSTEQLVFASRIERCHVIAKINNTNNGHSRHFHRKQDREARRRLVVQRPCSRKFLNFRRSRSKMRKSGGEELSLSQSYSRKLLKCKIYEILWIQIENNKGKLEYLIGFF